MIKVKEIRKAVKDLYTDTNVYIEVGDTVYPVKDIHRSVGGDCMVLIAGTTQSK